MFSKVDSHQKDSFLEQTKAQREERALEKQREKSALKIQSVYRGYKSRRSLNLVIRKEIEDLINKPATDDGEYTPNFKPALEVYKFIRGFLFTYTDGADSHYLELLCRYLLATMDSDDLKISYVSVSLLKQFVLPWIQQVKEILWKCVLCLKQIKPENHVDVKIMMVYLRMLITFTHTATWKIIKGKGEGLTAGMNQLCNNIMGHLNNKGLYPALQILLVRGLARSKPAFTKTSLTAVLTISLRPLLAANFSDNLLTLFVLNILSVPALVHHLSTTAPDCLTHLITNRVFKRSLDLLTNEQSTRIIFNSLEGNYALCLLANLIQLGYSELEGLVENTNSFMTVTIRLLDKCKNYVQNKRSNLTHWHPVLGWFSQKTDQGLHEAMPFVVKQLQILWCSKMVRLLFLELIDYVDYAKEIDTQKAASKDKGLFKKALDKASSKNAVSKIKLGSTIAQSTCLPCALYQCAMNTLSQLRLDIVSGLSYNEILLPILWRFLCDMGPNCGLKVFLDLLQQTPESTIHPVFSLLTLFCEAASNYICTLDHIEMFEHQKLFKVEDYIKMSEFLNLFVFRVVWGGLMSISTASSSEVFTSARGLLMILYESDSRRNYAPKDHWLIKDVKPSSFLSELDKGRKLAQFILQKIPHIIPFGERVKIFRKSVQKEREVLGLCESVSATPQSTLITVHRSRIVEDGYRQLAQVPPRAIKGVIRVRFINEQGLDEAGIDQDGVFKEFLEETITKVFDPSLNLFKVTSEQKLYPSSTSYIQENHLFLFEFVGKMLAKAVYEGIIVEVPFAPFFLTQILGHSFSSTYSSLDELPSLDPDLAKNLTYIKHFDDDVSDLDLTFCYDEDIMGRLETHELVPGGKAVAVTNDNRIRYVHLMAHFRMYRQIRDQTLAFIKGFKSVVNSDWLSMFSSPELQKLISGDTADMDTSDLRKHTQYYGGYHNNHKVINWLWDILEKDFNQADRAAFLKFVTSCSKAPLLGFAHLEPPFSIRCVEVSDDQDTGDTVGSVLKGFFNIKKRDPVGRLPTSSTCFNLLKLPNYQKKATLREKLKYAIHSNTGFELS
ncbi:ubiquitin-protein ligase E3B-like [Ruditapes philippinarum]|uniref:ubiquitin-protein ligase E3B-like n=1 Tax=Ruditapes philippinarum TaxID=129788 RepID=UPI00295B67CD|nr:ubiquitin-protein ligase E3B-like [Ruditapes philippinarum]